MTTYPENFAQSGAAALAFAIGDVVLKANPDAMMDKAGKLRANLSRIRTEFDEMRRSMERTGAYWNGEAAEMYRKQSREMNPIAEEMFQRLEEHASDLQKIATIYGGVEPKLVSEIETLPKDAIE